MFLLPLQMVGCSHESSDSATVGRLRLGAQVLEAWLQSLQRDGVHAVLLSTCHRTELYWSGDADLTQWFEAHVQSRVDRDLQLEHREADLAVRHLFSVAAGMCSVRYGEPEILRQVRTAWTTAQTLGTTDALLDTVFRRAVEAARHIRLAIGDDADAPIGARIRDLVLERHRDVTDVLIVGAGDAAHGTLEALTEASVRERLRVTVTSRSDDRAALTAGAFGVPVCPWSERDEAIAAADAVVFAVQAGAPLLDGSLVSQLRAARTTRALWIDLGVPATVDPRGLPACVELIGLDAVAPHSGRNAARDRRAHAALQRELARFAMDAQRRRIGSRISLLEERAASVARATVQGTTTGLSTDAADVVARRVTRALLREIAELSA